MDDGNAPPSAPSLREEVIAFIDANPKFPAQRVAERFRVDLSDVRRWMADRRRGILVPLPSHGRASVRARDLGEGQEPAPKPLTRRAKIERAIDHLLDALSDPDAAHNPLIATQAVALSRLLDASAAAIESDPNRALDVPTTAAEPAADIAARVASRLRGARKDSATG